MSECRYCGCGTDRRMVSCIDCDDAWTERIGRTYEENREDIRALRAEVERLRALCREAEAMLDVVCADCLPMCDRHCRESVALCTKLRAVGEVTDE